MTNPLSSKIFKTIKKKFQKIIIINRFKKIKIFNQDTNQEIIEEIAGTISSGAFIGLFALIGGGIALFAHPVVGTIILFFSIVYGSVVKVFAGKCYRKNVKVLPAPEDDPNKAIINLLKTNKHNIPCIRTDTSKYSFVRVLSPLGTKRILSPSQMGAKRYGLLSPLRSPKILPF